MSLISWDRRTRSSRLMKPSPASPVARNTKEGQSNFAASEARGRGAGAPAHLRRNGGQRVASSFRSARVALLNAGARAGWDRSFVRAAAANADVACAAAAFALLAYQVVRRPSANPPVATKVAAKWRSEHEQSLDLSLQRPSANSRPSQFAQGEGRSGLIPGRFRVIQGIGSTRRRAAEALLQTVTCRHGRPRPPKQTDLRPFLRSLGLVLGRGYRRVVVFGRAMLATR